VCFGLGRGAGIDSPDLKLLGTTHIDDRGEDGICVHVPGARARTVWLLRSYEQLVRRGLVGLRPGQFLIGGVKYRRNVAAAIYADAILLGSLPKIEQSRLRSTLLSELITQPVPVAVIMTAAGLKTTRTLFDLLPHIDTDALSSSDLLRGGGAA
jgi:hypothetical protein